MTFKYISAHCCVFFGALKLIRFSNWGIRRNQNSLREQRIILTLFLLSSSLAQADNITPLASEAYALDRILQVAVTCRYTAQLLEGQREGLELDPAAFGLKSETVLGTATIINSDGYVVTSKHLLDSFKEEESSYTDELGNVLFKYVCKEEDITMAFQGFGPYNGQRSFEEALNSRSVSKRYDALMTKVSRGNGGLFRYYCYSKDSIENNPENGLPTHNFGFAYIKPDRNNPAPEAPFTSGSGNVRITSGPSLQRGVIQMTQSTIEGMSGGPVVDQKNRLIGINKGFRRLDPESRPVLERNFFVPIQKFNEFLRESGESNCKLDEVKPQMISSPSSSTTFDEPCVNSLRGIDPERIKDIETNSGSMLVINSQQTKKKPFALLLRDNRKLLGIITLNVFTENGMFKIASIVNSDCQEIGSFSNISRRGDKNTLQNWDTLEVSINRKIYHLRVGYDSGEVSINYFRETVE
uniref:Serine protease n=1 Tax=uncultured Thiotrichaceae bacterium TaxID=298394 RepID=A0A6S6UCJ8_9GAMM|nr:MAG: Unknown protein [uncultured Thiotrichaceae bacterium]